MILLLCVLLLPAAALAQAADGGVSADAADGGTSDADAALKKELEGVIQQSTAGAAPAASTANPPPPAPSVQYRGTQSLNPDISAIMDANAGYERRGVSYRNGDDPDLKGGPDTRGAGFTVQEVELALSAIVDPYFKGEVYLTIPNLNGLEVEEAFATTTSLPGNFQVKMGSFRSAFGRQNGQHLHVQDFTRRPLINAAFLGVDGLRGPGAQVSWLTPLPFYLVLYAEAFSTPQPDVVAPLSTFGGGSPTDLTWVGEAKYFFPVGEEWSIYGGFSSAFGKSAGFTSPDVTATVVGAAQRTELFGGDLYVKWKPPNVAGGYTSVAWQTEAVFRHLSDFGEWDGGLYSQIVMQIARNWFVGVRGDALGLPQSSAVARTLRGSVSLTWQGSEFSRVRAYVEGENVSGTGAYLPAVSAGANPSTSYAAYLQLEYSIGAHGAHPF